MRRLLTRFGGLAAAAMLTVGLAHPSQAADPAYFEFTDATRQTAVVRIDDPAKIAHARQLLSGGTTDRPHLFGRIVKREAPYNPRWSFHYDPSTVDFFDVAIEVCDAPLPYVEDHLDEAGGAFLPGLFWCPWTSRLTREVPAP
ncbi:calmodulin-binding protein [Streptomyces bauhiniae]|uniref:Calmodulin-binding protein n=1 Tax=Streptomyces bauhiniae TaxID=2340725 RepID=A0A4Z1D018_9ACTN|nr:calmodulin-binding protein [Streptomyces bauhiniae]TGN74702.1 calmodulin-binding protein [Streptomyces bauhiniae]